MARDKKDKETMDLFTGKTQQEEKQAEVNSDPES